MRNCQWSCSTLVARLTRINSQESFGTSQQTLQLHAIGHGQVKRSIHHQMNAHQEQQQREQCPCYHCGRNHATATCQFKDAVCHMCYKKGHFAKVCRSKRPTQNQGSRTTHQIAVDDNCVSDTSEAYKLFNLQETRTKPLVVTVKLNNSTLDMELDTEASLSIIRK